MSYHHQFQPASSSHNLPLLQPVANNTTTTTSGNGISPIRPFQMNGTVLSSSNMPKFPLPPINISSMGSLPSLPNLTRLPQLNSGQPALSQPQSVSFLNQPANGNQPQILVPIGSMNGNLSVVSSYNHSLYLHPYDLNECPLSNNEYIWTVHSVHLTAYSMHSLPLIPSLCLSLCCCL